MSNKKEARKRLLFIALLKLKLQWFQKNQNYHFALLTLFYNNDKKMCLLKKTFHFFHLYFEYQLLGKVV